LHLNYSIKEINDKQATEKYKIKDIKKRIPKFSPALISKYIIEIYLNFSKHTEFMEEVIEG